MELTPRQISYLNTLHGWCVTEKMNVLYGLVMESAAKLKPNEPLIVAELGVFAGRSLFPMAMACQQLGIGQVWGFEMWDSATSIEGEEISPENTDYWEKMEAQFPFIQQCFLKSILFLGLEEIVRWKKLKSYDAAGAFEDGSVSLLHQDSQHNTHTIIKELDAWAPKIKLGGFWVVDDSDWPSTKEGYAKIPDYGFELVKPYKCEVPNTNPQQYTEFAVYRKVR